jgi:valyl-tRNA synthetase
MLQGKYNFMDSEKKWQEYWKEKQIYKFDRESDREIYSIDTPPPTVSGSLHIGHIFSYTQAEMIARYHRMQGKNVFYPFGFDDNGLPTERLVEKEEGIRAKDLPRSEFIRKCLGTTRKYEEEFRQLWQSLGFSVDWDLQYETISPGSQKISQASFLDLARKGKAYIREMPVLWCTTCQTSIAQAELETAEKESGFNYIIFMVGEERLSVATTRPELLYGVVALFVNPLDDRYAKRIGGKAVVPLYDYEVPILGDEKVSLEKGTGVVMCATFGDTADLEWFNSHGLSYRKVICTDGSIAEEVPLIGGKKVQEARELIITRLRETGLLEKSESIVHTTAVHERCSKAIEIIPSRQWYIDILSHKQEFLQAGEQIEWYPASMKIRYDHWVENLKWDWCISRQRYFGVPLPVWYCSKCGKTLLAHESQLPVNPLETMPEQACECGSTGFVPEEAVMDTWATSSVTPMINGKWGEEEDFTEKLLPMSMRTQAHEIIRTWAFYTIVKSIYHTGKIPWKDIMICGFVMAKKGEKISKSKNNAESSPKALVLKHSADAVRYWAANARLGSDTMFAEEDLLVSHRFLTKLWNASKFALLHLPDYNCEPPAVIKPIDRWILSRRDSVFRAAKETLNQYEAGMARGEIDAFFWNDFCDNYLEIVKDRLYKPEIHGVQEKRSAQYALYRGLLGILELYAIYVPHMTEEIYQAYFRRQEELPSIHLLQWEEPGAADQDILRFGEITTEIVGEVRKYKSQRNLSMKVPISRLEITVPAEYKGMLEETLKDLKACTAAEEMILFSGEALKINVVG